jgi:lysophospholipase L1-like esterase
MASAAGWARPDPCDTRRARNRAGWREVAMKTMLCYGDSNTWGYDPASRSRLGPDARWTGVAAAALGPDVRVVEEGLNGRTTIVDDPIEPNRNGLAYLLPCLESHKPLDGVVIMLGTNDLKARFGRRPSDIADSAGLLAGYAASAAYGSDGRPPRVLLVCPPALTTLTDFDAMFEGGREKSLQLPEYFRRAAGWGGHAFFDANTVIRCSDLDGIHFEADAHAALGRAIASAVGELL